MVPAAMAKDGADAAEDEAAEESDGEHEAEESVAPVAAAKPAAGGLANAFVAAAAAAKASVAAPPAPAPAPAQQKSVLPPPPPRVGSDVSHAAAHTENKAYCALPHAYRRPLRRPSPASLSSCAEYARRLLCIQFVVRESRCAGPEPDTWELQKLLLQRTNSPNIIWLQFHNFGTSKKK